MAKIRCYKVDYEGLVPEDICVEIELNENENIKFEYKSRNNDSCDQIYNKLVKDAKLFNGQCLKGFKVIKMKNKIIFQSEGIGKKYLSICDDEFKSYHCIQELYEQALSQIRKKLNVDVDYDLFC